MASRVVPASGAVSSRSSPSSRLTSVDLPAFGRPTMATRIGCGPDGSAAASICAGGVLGQRRAQRVVEIGQAFVVLGRNRDRVAEAERIGVQPPALAGGAFHLVGDQHGRLAGLAHQLGEHAVDPGRTGARVDHEEDRVGLPDRGLGLRPHAAGEAFGRGLLEPGGIDHGEIEVAEPALAFAAVARHARPVVDQRHAPADQPVEQGRLADIGAADDGDGEAHGG